MPDTPAATATPAGTPARRICVLVRDLIFSTKIKATATAIGASVRMIASPGQLLVADPMQSPCNLLIADLNLAGAIEAAAAWKQRTGGRVAGFVSHVDKATIEMATAAGIDQILPRSKFVMVLPELLAGSAGVEKGSA